MAIYKRGLELMGVLCATFVPMILVILVWTHGFQSPVSTVSDSPPPLLLMALIFAHYGLLFKYPKLFCVVTLLEVGLSRWIVVNLDPNRTPKAQQNLISTQSR
jgi:hypothetical protein